MQIRKNQNTLTKPERMKFVNAVNKLKDDGTYDKFPQDHVDAAYTPTPPGSDSSAAHVGPHFPPWHREFIKKFELALQEIDPKVILPYWDWTVDNQISSSIWDAAFMGGSGLKSNNYKVTTGPFANWVLTVKDPHSEDIDENYLQRSIGVKIHSLPSSLDVKNVLEISPYDAAPWNNMSNPSFRNFLEGWIPKENPPHLHNQVHVWVGGSMARMSSPNDPIFFLHHAMIDRIWASWQKNHKNGFLPTGDGPQGQNLDDKMFPWNTASPADVLDTTELDYEYDSLI